MFDFVSLEKKKHKAGSEFQNVSLLKLDPQEDRL